MFDVRKMIVPITLSLQTVTYDLHNHFCLIKLLQKNYKVNNFLLTFLQFSVTITTLWKDDFSESFHAIIRTTPRSLGHTDSRVHCRLATVVALLIELEAQIL